MDTEERWSAAWIQQQAIKVCLGILDKLLATALLDNPHKPVADILRDLRLKESARAIEVRNSTPPDAPSRRQATTPASRTKK